MSNTPPHAASMAPHRWDHVITAAVLSLIFADLAAESGCATVILACLTMTASLIGVAIKDGHIRSIDDMITRYLPDLSGTAYEGENGACCPI